MATIAKHSRNTNDQHYKTLFRTFLRELMQIAYPHLCKKLRFDKCRFLDKETYTDLLGGKGYRLDLVCEIPTTDGGCRLILIHVEIEERRRKLRISFGQRMAYYCMSLSLRHQVPVLPLAVTFWRHQGGLAMEKYHQDALGQRVLTLRYRRVGVGGMEAAQFLRGRNPLGWALAVRMKHPGLNKVDLQLACERKIVQADMDESRKILLLDSVRTYSKLRGAELKEYAHKLQEQQNQELKEQAMTWLEKERKAAKRQGERLGEKKSLVKSISKFWANRFGPMPQDVAKRLKAVPEPGQLERIFDALFTARDQADALGKLADLCPAR